MEKKSFVTLVMGVVGGLLFSLGLVLAVLQLEAGNISLAGCLLIILLSADYFIPMRRLGSYFHIAMNGMAACDKIFKLLYIEETEERQKEIGVDRDIQIKDLAYSYEEDREILHGFEMELPQGKMVAIVGESGCGKSTIAGILSGKNKGYTGSVTIGGVELEEIKEESLMKNITLVSHNSYLFKGTVRDNLLMGKPDATDEECISVLKKVKLYDFLMEEKGLDTVLLEKASNLWADWSYCLSLRRGNHSVSGFEDKQ